MSISLRSFVFAAFVAGAPLAFAVPFAPGDLEPATKCCKPAALVPPTTGCTTTCRPTMTCANGQRAGTITPGACQASGDKCTLSPGMVSPKPMYSCKIEACTLPDGSPGSKCVWSLAGGHPTETITFTDCSGTPCGN